MVDFIIPFTVMLQKNADGYRELSYHLPIGEDLDGRIPKLYMNILVLCQRLNIAQKNQHHYLRNK